MPNAAAEQLLYDNLASLPSSEYGPINLLPFAHDSEQTRLVKRQVCQSIVGLLETHGLLKDETPKSMIAAAVSVKCRACLSSLVETVTDEHGAAHVDARAFIAAMAGLNPECPHSVLTADDLRAHMEQEFVAQMGDEE